MDRKSDVTSVASLCDWSPRRDSPPKRLPKPSRLVTARNKYLKPRSLTKGEQEIIIGICSNRGLKTKTVVESSSITSHKDAWSYDKNMPKKHPLENINGNECLVFEDNNTDYGIKSHYHDCRVCTNQSKYYCADCGKLTAKILTDDERQLRERGCITPPSSPREGVPNSLNSKQIIPPIKSSAGATYVKRTHHKGDKNSSRTAIKTTMNIFLPKLDGNSDTSNPNVVIEEDSLVAPMNLPSNDESKSKYSFKNDIDIYRYKIDSNDMYSSRPNPNERNIFVWNPMDVDWESFSMSGRRPNYEDPKRYLAQNRIRHQFGTSSVPVPRSDRDEVNSELSIMVKASSAPVIKQHTISDQMGKKSAFPTNKEPERVNTPAFAEKQAGQEALTIFKQSKKRQNEANAKALQQTSSNDLVKTKTIYFQDPFAIQSRSQTLP